MNKLIEKIKESESLRNCKLLAPIVYLCYLPGRKQYAIDVIRRFMGKNVPTKVQRRLIRKMVWNRVVYHINFTEYFLYDVEKLSGKGKRAIIGLLDNAHEADRMNRPENRELFNDKMLTYNRFKEFYGRDVCLVKSSGDSLNEFSEFVRKHPKFIAKPLSESLGIGVAVFDAVNYSSAEELHSALVAKYKEDFLAEELIVSVEELAMFHPSSVNTLRMPTYRFDDRIEVRHPFLRIGRRGAVVDNAGQGGIIALIDSDTGIVFSAADESGRNYVIHPETGVQIIGYKIPKWEEAKEFAKKLAQVVPENRYTGWDIALTEKGWVMVEGNSRAHFLHQMPLRKGYREELEGIIADMKIKK